MTKAEINVINTFSKAMEKKYNTDLNSMAQKFVDDPKYGESVIEEILNLLKDEKGMHSLGLDIFSEGDLALLEQSYLSLQKTICGDVTDLV